jgi:hypothetical protein
MLRPIADALDNEPFRARFITAIAIGLIVQQATEPVSPFMAVVIFRDHRVNGVLYVTKVCVPIPPGLVLRTGAISRGQQNKCSGERRDDAGQFHRRFNDAHGSPNLFVWKPNIIAAGFFPAAHHVKQSNLTISDRRRQFRSER